MLNGVIVLVAIICAAQAIRSQRLLNSAIWLATASALTALLIYLLGVPQLAVIELSVGAGLVTVLFVLAISISGEEAFSAPTLVPKPLALAVVFIAAALLAWSILPLPPISIFSASSFTNVFWHERGLDVLAQIVLIFAGVLGVLNLVVDERVEQPEAISGLDEAHLPIAQTEIETETAETPEVVHA